MRFGKHVRPRSLANQLLVIYLLAMLFSGLLMAALVAVMLGWQRDALIQRLLHKQAVAVSQGLRFDAGARPVAIAEGSPVLQLYRAVTADSLKYRVLDAQGRVLLAPELGARALHPDGVDFDPADTGFAGTVDGQALHVRTARFEQGGQAYYVQAAAGEGFTELALNALVMPLQKVLLWAAAISLLVFAAAMYTWLCSTLKPLREASAAAAAPAAIGPHSVSTRLASGGVPTEMLPLVDAFNAALGRLETGYRAQREFLGAAAHELKTPLALIRGQIELNGTGDRATLLADVDFMARQVHQLLHLAEASEAQNYVFEDTDLGSLADEVARYLARLADRRNVRIRVHSAPQAALHRADRATLFILLKNLVENALQHAPEGSSVTLALDAQSLSVSDEGPGIAPEHLPQLFQRFWRGPQRREQGAGLGLAICQEIATAHGWRLSAGNGARGARFALAFG
jgi:signal transduction histidine kinase